MSPFRISSLVWYRWKHLASFGLFIICPFPKVPQSMMANLPRTRVWYATIDDDVRPIIGTGQGCFLAKTDIKNTFRLTPIRPADYGFLGIHWRGFCYCDRCMPMGCSISCLTFEMFSSAVEWVVHHQLKIGAILYLLDDVLSVAPSPELSQTQLSLFIFISLWIPWDPHGSREETSDHHVFCRHRVGLDDGLFFWRLGCLSIKLENASRLFPIFCLVRRLPSRRSGLLQAS